MDQSTERKLLERCRHGDSEAFGEIYDAYARPLYAFIYYKVHHRQTAEDLLGQVWLKAVENLDRFNEKRGRISSWLYRIARNQVIDHYRRHVPGADIEDVWGLADPASAETDADTRLKVDMVREHLTRLKPTEREIVIMRVWQELSYAEIAEIVGKSQGNCKVIYSRAVAKLRDSMPLAAWLAFLLAGWRP